MRLFIRRKSIYHLILVLHTLFLSLPVSHAGDIVLCYKDAGQIDIEVKMPEGCSSCDQAGGNLEKQDPCFCVDIPLSRGAVEHSTLFRGGTSQGKPHAELQSFSSGECDPFSPDNIKVSILFTPPASTRSIHESLRTTVLRI
jgi:hypothetical protein